MLDVGAVEVLDVVGIEHRLHWLDLLQLGLDSRQQAGLEHLGVDRCFVYVVFIYVPATEHDVVKVCQRYEVFNLGHAIFSALAKTYSAHLSQ